MYFFITITIEVAQSVAKGSQLLKEQHHKYKGFCMLCSSIFNINCCVRTAAKYFLFW